MQSANTDIITFLAIMALGAIFAKLVGYFIDVIGIRAKHKAQRTKGGISWGFVAFLVFVVGFILILFTNDFVGAFGFDSLQYMVVSVIVIIIGFIILWKKVLNK